MACKLPISSFSDLSYDCNASFGGIKGIKISDKAKTKVVEIEFNDKDGFSNFAESLAVAPEGTVTNTQTVSFEVPRLSKEKYEAIESFSDPNMELVVYILTKAGRMITAGLDFGAYVSLCNAASGTGRTDKNRVQVTLTADEESLSVIADNGEAAYAAIVVKLEDPAAQNLTERRTKNIDK